MNEVVFGGAAAVISNSILTGSTGGDCTNTDGAISGGNNLADDNSSGACSGVSSAAVTGLESSLQDNGSSGSGPTLQTHMLFPGSNAIDGAPAAGKPHAHRGQANALGAYHGRPPGGANAKNRLQVED